MIPPLYTDSPAPGRALPRPGALSRAWYRLTASIPRRLPRTPDEYARFKAVLVWAFGVPDEPKAWITVAGQVRSVKAISVKCPWGHIANAANRLAINELATADHGAQVRALNTRLKTAVGAEIERMRAAGEDTKDAESYLRGLNGEQDPQEQPQGGSVPVPAPDQIQ